MVEEEIQTASEFLDFSEQISKLPAIGVSAFKGTGKTTFCESLKKVLCHSTDVYLIAFADPIKEIFGAPLEYMEMPKKEQPFPGALNSMNIQKIKYRARSYVEKVIHDKKQAREAVKDLGHVLDKLPSDASPRLILQHLGTEWGRECVDKDFWVKLGIAKMKEVRARGGICLIHDLRFDNEAMAIKTEGGKCFQLYRQNYKPTESDGHASERGVSPSLIDGRINIACDIREAADTLKSMLLTQTVQTQPSRLGQLIK